MGRPGQALRLEVIWETRPVGFNAQFLSKSGEAWPGLERSAVQMETCSPEMLPWDPFMEHGAAQSQDSNTPQPHSCPHRKQCSGCSSFKGLNLNIRACYGETALWRGRPQCWEPRFLDSGLASLLCDPLQISKPPFPPLQDGGSDVVKQLETYGQEIPLLLWAAQD